LTQRYRCSKLINSDDSDDEAFPTTAQDMFSDDSDAASDGAEMLPPTLHDFDLDAAPPAELDMGSDDEMDMDEFDELDDEEPELDEFGVEEESEDDDEDEVDSAFASSGDEDEMEVDEDNDPRTAHLRPNPRPGSDDEDEDGAITTNLEDDLTNEGYTLPAVDNGGEVEEFEHGTSLRDVEQRMRWLVGVCMGKGEKVSNGVPGK
jgi:ribosomal RNA methyltransferase Nop2